MGSVILDTYKTVATEMKYSFKYMNYVPIVVATDLEVHFSVLNKGANTFVYIVYVPPSKMYRWCASSSVLFCEYFTSCFNNTAEFLVTWRKLVEWDAYLFRPCFRPGIQVLSEVTSDGQTTGVILQHD